MLKMQFRAAVSSNRFFVEFFLEGSVVRVTAGTTKACQNKALHQISALSNKKNILLEHLRLCRPQIVSCSTFAQASMLGKE